MSVTVALLLVGSYLLGSVPFGLWIVLRLKGIDIRTVGSGNIGATNVSRVCGAAVGRLVFVLDLLKGLLPPLIAKYLLHLDSPDSRWVVLAALLAILGHNFSVFLGFRGGKGISTSGGALFGAAPLAGLGVAVIFLLVFFATSTISIGSVAAAAALPFVMYGFYRHDVFLLGFGIAASAMAIWKHRKNIGRIVAGTEPKVNLFKKRLPEDSAAAGAPAETETRPNVGR